MGGAGVVPCVGCGVDECDGIEEYGFADGAGGALGGYADT